MNSSGFILKIDKGHPYDNAVMECFLKYLKKEEVNRKFYSSF